jgi:N-acetylglucosaminyldiphosphoundecaprenol N-acetyl-beta-D-mannosaminyltransferase
MTSVRQRSDTQSSGDMHSERAYEIRGIRVDAIDVYRARDEICARARTARGDYVTVSGAPGIVASVYDERIHEAHRQAALVVADGMPVVWLGRLLGFSSIGRVNGPELMELIFEKEEYRKLRHFFYGARPSTISELIRVIESRFGPLNAVGTYSPPIRPIGFSEDEEVLARIRALKPDLVWISLSTPKQEVWMQMHMRKIGCGLGVGVGAAFDLLAGTVVRAPRWIQRSGFEWLFRLAVEPRRLYKRYFFVVPRFAYICLETFIKQRLGIPSSER